MPVQKKQHYVPKFYLKSFGNPIYCFDKTNNRVHNVSINEIARRDYFYEIPDIRKAIIEKEITSPLDNDFSIVFNKYIENQDFESLSITLQKKLSHFIAFQLCRTNSILEHTLQTVSRFTDDEYTKFNFDKNSETDSPPKLAKKIFLYTLFNRSKTLAEIISKRKWKIIKANSDTNLWTSDHPVVLFNGRAKDGMPELRADLTLEKQTQIHFPINSTMLLVCYDSETYQINMENLDSDGIRLENMFQIANAGRFLYSKINDFDYACKFLSQNSTHRNPPHKLF